MKNYLYATLAILLLGSCKKTSTGAPPMTVDPYIAANYQADAQQLLERLYLNGGLTAGADEVELNTAQLQIIEGRLSDVYRLHDELTNRIFDTLKLHTYTSIDLKSIDLEIDSSSAAGKQVVDYLPSGDAGFDGLMSKYGFSYTPPPPPDPNYGFVTITSAQSWNISALIKSLQTYAFVKDAEDNEFIGDGNDITYQLEGNNAIITFLKKGGDCFDGCEVVNSWRFRVDANGKATYLGQ